MQNKFHLEDFVHAVLMAKKTISVDFKYDSLIFAKFPCGCTILDISSPSLEQFALNVVNKNQTTGVITGIGYDNSVIENSLHSITFSTDDVASISFC